VEVEGVRLDYVSSVGRGNLVADRFWGIALSATALALVIVAYNVGFVVAVLTLFFRTIRKLTDRRMWRETVSPLVGIAIVGTVV
jgi:hypothetical protein